MLSLQACPADAYGSPFSRTGDSVISKSDNGLHPAKKMDHYINEGWCLFETRIDEAGDQVLNLAGIVDSPCGPLRQDVFCFTGMKEFAPEKNSLAGVACKLAIVFDQCNKF